MEYQIEYDGSLGCYLLCYAGEVLCMGAETLEEAHTEAQMTISNWVEPWNEETV